MNDKELKQARKQYRTAVKENKKLEEIQKEIEELKQSKEVLRYIELLKYENEQKKSDEEIVKSSFNPIGYTTNDSDNIYVYIEDSEGNYSKSYTAITMILLGS